MGKKIADELIETIKEAGIKRIYAVTGDSLMRLTMQCGGTKV